MYSIEFTQKASDQLSRLEEDLQVRIVKTLERIKIRPADHVIKLVGLNAYKFRIGDYRIICAINYDKQIIYILKVGHRSMIYK